MLSPQTANAPQKGFSLPEIMVGMVIGLLGIIIIMQVTSVFEGRKRTTAGGDDAQNAGAIALYSLQRDIAQAGYGVSSTNLVTRSLSTPFINFASMVPVTVNHASLAGIRDANTDTLIVIYGNSNTTPEGVLITNVTATLPYQISDGTGNRAPGEGGKAFHIGDWVVPSQSGVVAGHTMFQVIGPVDALNVAVSGVAPALLYTNNQPNPPLLFNLGATPTIMAYAIINEFLSSCDYMTTNCGASVANWTPLSGDVVSLKAQCENNSSLRLALITRNIVKANGAALAASAPIWNPGGVSAPVTANPGTDWGADWGNYRYKTFETVVPIRNVTWSGARGC